MTEQEVIKVFGGFKFLPREQKAVDIAIKSLEKQIPKEVIFVHPLQEDDGGDYMCPTCKNGTVLDPYGKETSYCHYCGQAIKWE